MTRIVYTGNFKDLIPKDWIFQKLYARNYRTYRKEFKGLDTLWLWQAKRELEINDFSCNSVWLLKKILLGDHNKWKIFTGYYEVKHDRKYSFNQDIVDYLLLMYSEGLIKIEDV